MATNRMRELSEQTERRRRRRNARDFILFLIAAYVWVAIARFRFVHPEATETQIFNRFVGVLMFE